MTSVETIGYSADWSTRAVRYVRTGGHVLATLRLDGDRCAPLEIVGARADMLVFVPIDLQLPSSRGDPVGSRFDLLVPRNAATCSLSPYVLAEWQAWQSGAVTIATEGRTATVDVVVGDLAIEQQRPFLVGMTASYIMAAHCDPQCPAEVPLIDAYGDMLAAHRVQPIQSWIRFPPVVDGRLDLDAGGDGSFRARVMAYAGGGLVGFPRARWYEDREAYLSALERTIREEGLAGRAWVYAADEPGDIDALAVELAAYRRLAPDVRIMVTTALDSRLDGLVDIYAPVLNRLGRKGWPGADAYDGFGLWPYVSCMGSCGPNRAGDPAALGDPGPDTGLPDMLMDRPAERLFAYFRELGAIQAEAGLYYEAVEGHRLALVGIDVLDDPWNFGGNGDGVLVYPGRAGMFGLAEDQPLASWRLKLIRYAIETWW